MSLGETLLQEIDQEMPATRRLLVRVPGDEMRWKPHAKSFSLGHLAQLVSWMPGWIAQTMRETTLDLQGSPPYRDDETPESVLAAFDRNVAAARQALPGAIDDDFAVVWSLQRGNQALFSAPRSVVVRNHINHLVHHRGQLTVYLRLLDVPLPSIYGPTADEKW